MPVSNLTSHIQGLPALTSQQVKALDEAADLDGDGKVDYFEWGGASGYSSRNFADGAKLREGVSVDNIIDALRARKETIAKITSVVEMQTFDEARKLNHATPYFGGFFDSSERTLFDEVKDFATAHGTSQARLDKLAKIIDAVPRNENGKFGFEVWGDLFTKLVKEFDVKFRPMLHGSQWGPLD